MVLQIHDELDFEVPVEEVEVLSALVRETMEGVAELRVRCAAAGISSIDTKGTRAVLYRSGSNEIFKVVDLPGKSPRKKLAELAGALEVSGRS